MKEFFEVLQAAGPFTAPLCFGMAFVVNWLLKRLNVAEGRVATLEIEVRSLIERRAEAAAKGAADFQLHTQATYAALERLAKAVQL